jgi:hypothetical protein
VLAGRGPQRLPGVGCDHCGATSGPDGRSVKICNGCHSARSAGARRRSGSPRCRCGSFRPNGSGSIATADRNLRDMPAQRQNVQCLRCNLTTGPPNFSPLSLRARYAPKWSKRLC